MKRSYSKDLTFSESWSPPQNQTFYALLQAIPHLLNDLETGKQFIRPRKVTLGCFIVILHNVW